MARFVSVIGTGLNGSGMDNGPRMQITAVISPISVICLVRVFVCPGSVCPGKIFRGEPEACDRTGKTEPAERTDEGEVM